MLFWTITAALVALIGLLLGLALLRGHAGEEPAAAYDLRVYRDQLRDVERDQARGVLGADEAARLKVEISRRVLEADRAAQGAGAARRPPIGATLAIAALGLAILGGAFALYQRLGAAGYPDQPLSERIAISEEIYQARASQDEAEKVAEAERGPAPAPDARFAELMERLRKAVQDRPNDLEGLALLARNEANIGNFRAGWEAQRRMIALKGDAVTAADYAELGELMIVAAGGLVTPEAEAALGKALELDQGEQLARYYVGLMMAQNGRGDRAFRIWSELLREGPESAPWIAPIRANIQQLAWIAGEPNYTPPPVGASGPSAADMAAAAAMSPEERNEMIRGMVEQLNQKLANEGGTASDWARLIASLRILGENDRADAVFAEAQGVFAGRDEDLATIAAANDGTVPAGGQAPAPTADQVDAAAAMTPEERQEMIRGMVDGLNDRLLAEGGSAEEWSRLISSLAMLGDAPGAQAALAAARENLADQPEALAAVTAAAEAAGIAP
ncbi:MAG: c-type cytochrome biogenesis protein CcmI [Paracoccaceae bacterium]